MSKFPLLRDGIELFPCATHSWNMKCVVLPIMMMVTFRICDKKEGQFFFAPHSLCNIRLNQ